MQKTIKLSYQVTGILVALLWLFQASAVAGIYKWRDDQGKLHFTDSKSKIPLKYRKSTQKFKGVIEPKVKVEAPVEESETPPSEEEAKKAENNKAEPEKINEVKKAEPEPMDPETIQALKTARTYLKDENFAFLRVFQRPYDENRAQKYVETIKSMIEKKTKTIKRLKGFKLKSIRKTRSFLSGALVQDRQLEESKDPEVLKQLRKQILRGADKKKVLIKKLLDDFPSGVDTNESDETLTSRIFKNMRK